jgi:hypothetical protein
MIYLKSAAVGVATALAACVLWILVVFVLPIFVPFLAAWITGSGGGSAAVISSDSIAIVGLVGFVAGFWWRLRGVRL